MEDGSVFSTRISHRPPCVSMPNHFHTPVNLCPGVYIGKKQSLKEGKFLTPPHAQQTGKACVRCKHGRPCRRKVAGKGLGAAFDALEAYCTSCMDEVFLLRETDLSTLDMQLNPLHENASIGE